MEFIIGVLLILAILYLWKKSCSKKGCDEHWHRHYEGECHTDEDCSEDVCDVEHCDKEPNECENDLCDVVEDVVDVIEDVVEDVVEVVEDVVDSISASMITVTVSWTSKSKERKWNGSTWKKGETRIMDYADMPEGTVNGAIQKNGLIISW